MVSGRWELRPIRAEFDRLGIDWDLPAYEADALRGAGPLKVEVVGQKP